MAQALSYQPLTIETWVHTHVFLVDKVALEQDFV
jgi:hypothetical protein